MPPTGACTRPSVADATASPHRSIVDTAPTPLWSSRISRSAEVGRVAHNATRSPILIEGGPIPAPVAAAVTVVALAVIAATGGGWASGVRADAGRRASGARDGCAQRPAG